MSAQTVGWWVRVRRHRAEVRSDRRKRQRGHGRVDDGLRDCQVPVARSTTEDIPEGELSRAQGCHFLGQRAGRPAREPRRVQRRGDDAVKLSIVIPAFNEEAYLPATLNSVRAGVDHLRAHRDTNDEVSVDVIVVDNNSTDETGRHRPERRVRGWCTSRCRASPEPATPVPAMPSQTCSSSSMRTWPCHLRCSSRSARRMRDPWCIGGGVDVDHRPRRLAVRLYLHVWRILGRLTGMVQGATQFCRKGVFEQVGGYDENVWIGEDVDFYRSLRRLARDPSNEPTA